jgi:hypothetical protein
MNKGDALQRRDEQSRAEHERRKMWLEGVVLCSLGPVLDPTGQSAIGAEDIGKYETDSRPDRGGSHRGTIA